MAGRYVKQLFQKHNVLTIPNLLSLVRLCLIPVIMRLYIGEHRPFAAVAVIVLSGITDVLDGWIARRFHMVSDLGKILDPLADKLTQAAMLVCLLERYRVFIWVLIGLLAVKEIVQGVLGYVTLRRYGEVNSANWYGKVCTAVLYAVMVVLFLFPQIPDATAATMIGCCAAVMLLSLTGYVIFYIRIFREKKE